MSNDSVPQKEDSVPMHAGVQVLQKVGVLSAKAALSSIPWAALVFDLGQLGVDFANARLTDRLLDGIGERIDRLEAGTRERLAADEVYQLSAHAAIRRMLSETNPRMADALARAVVELGASDLPSAERLEIARALDVLTEPSLHLLQLLYRTHYELLTEPELQRAGHNVSFPRNFTALVYAAMPITSWIAPASILERAGLVEVTVDDGEFGAAAGPTKAHQRPAVHMRRVYVLGERIVRMCFDDLSVPAFGAFAPEMTPASQGSAGDA